MYLTVHSLSSFPLGLRATAIENLGVTEDQYQCLDFSDNEIVTIENFPLLKQLQSLLLSNNRIKRIQRRLNQFLPNLTALVSRIYSITFLHS